jgi:hypothetical protein
MYYLGLEIMLEIYHLFAERQKCCLAFLALPLAVRISNCGGVAVVSKVVSLSNASLGLGELRKMIAVTVMPWLTYSQIEKGVSYSLTHRYLG